MIAETIRHLGLAVPLLKQVGGAAEFQAAAQSNPKAVPAAYVIPQRETGGASPTFGRTRQKVAASLVVVLAVRNVSDVRGEASGVDLVELRAQVDAALLGWAPKAGFDPFEFEGGALAAFRDGYMWWQDAYRTQFTKSNA